ncbi:NUDIX domain-containing protein [Egicoccus halophilus]|uniref:ADP-ribose pyrophosphatase n=1 Tax=Egicoccus halophilus TaxID=1670830 RepID=A0A8J3EU01_9ACTN|nr:NUDIX hydrolase [Egicoccus halophilus]GGI04923.1 ADP-ribose pyrophosphatase [Egicoccus halophilus]
MTAWFETTRQRTVYEGRARVRIDTVRMPEGEEVEREIVEQRSAVAVVPVTPDGEVFLLKQYRQSVGAYVLEIPAGQLDDDDPSPADAARRELVEEIGHDAGELESLTVFLNSAGWTTERTAVFLARDPQPAPRPEDFVAEHEEADMEVVRLPFDEALALVMAGEITDAKTVVGLLLAARTLGR